MKPFRRIFFFCVSLLSARPVFTATNSFKACDFETSDLCGWRQPIDDNFDWIRRTGETPSRQTGPSTDHTYEQTGKGHYMYIEGSWPRKAGDYATLISPVYLAEQSLQCFELWYHMLGPNGENMVGSLEIFVKPESRTVASISPSFHVDGNHGDQWLLAKIQVPQLTERLQIVVVGKRLEDHLSDISVDDVRLYNCVRVSTEMYTTNHWERTTVTTTPVSPTRTEEENEETEMHHIQITSKTRIPPEQITTKPSEEAQNAEQPSSNLTSTRTIMQWNVTRRVGITTGNSSKGTSTTISLARRLSGDIQQHKTATNTPVFEPQHTKIIPETTDPTPIAAGATCGVLLVAVILVSLFIYIKKLNSRVQPLG